METKGDRARLQVWLPVDLLDRIVVAAQEADRPVSREVVRRLEASFGERPAGAMGVDAPVVSPRPRVPPETPEPQTVDRVQTVERLQQQVPGVKTASTAFPSVPQDLAGPVKPRPRSG